MPRKRFCTDYGGNRGFFGKGRGEQWRCDLCRRRQMESRLARHRRTRVRCKWCGGVSRPVHEDVVAKIKVRKCKKCKCVLRVGNPMPVCNPCFNAATYWQRKHYMGLP